MFAVKFFCLHLLLLLLLELTCVGSLNLGSLLFSSSSSRQSIKKDIITLAKKVNRGLTETPKEREKILDLFYKLEKLNPNKSTLSSPNVNAIWKLEYTTSDSILGKNPKLTKIGEIFQTVDSINLTAENAEVVEYFGFLRVPRRVTAKLSPLTKTEVKVNFQTFFVGPLAIPAPSSATGRLDITYVDEDFRLSRGDKGSFFILSKYAPLPAAKSTK